MRPRNSHNDPLDQPTGDHEDMKTETRASKNSLNDFEVPLSFPGTRKKVSNDAIVGSGKLNRVRFSDNVKKHDIKFIVVKCVKKCIEEVNSKLDRGRFKLLCRKVSKRMLRCWASRKAPHQRNIHRWLKKRRAKIIELVRKYF